MTFVVCLDRRHDTLCLLPCDPCSDELCDQSRYVTVTTTVDGLYAPIHPHESQQFDPDCPACELAESGILNDGSIERRRNSGGG